MTIQEYLKAVGERTHSHSWQSLHRIDSDLYECCFQYSGNRGIQIDVTVEALEDAMPELLIESAVTHIFTQLALSDKTPKKRVFWIDK